MSTPGPFGEGLPIDPMQLARILSAEGPVNWEWARLVAGQVAAQPPEGEGEAAPGNVDPLRRIRLEELARVAELHVGQATGLATSVTGRPLSVRAATPAQWAEQTLQDYKPYLETLAVALAPSADDTGPIELPPGMEALAPMFAELPKMLAPMLMGMQSGLLVGQLATHAFGAYELPVPRPPRDELWLIDPTLERFSRDWSLPVDDVAMWATLHETTTHAVYGAAHVRSAVDGLLRRYVGGFKPGGNDLLEKLEGLENGDFEGLQQALADPEMVLDAMETDEQRAIKPRLGGLVAVVEGYVAHVVDVVGSRLIGPHAALSEALRRRRASERPSDRFVVELLGMSRGEQAYDRGLAFVRGVLERAGEEGLARLWESERTLPTPAEVGAPGLWLARLETLD